MSQPIKKKSTRGPTKQKNFRLPFITADQIEYIQEATGMTETQIIISAIDDMARKYSSKQQAQES